MTTIAVPATSYADAKQPVNSLAALALGLAFVTVVGGIVCGHAALTQIRRTGERGRGLAIAALVIGYGYLGGFAALFGTILIGGLLAHAMR